MNTPEMISPLLEIKDLKVYFKGRKKLLPAVDGVTLTVYPREIVGIVGESGSGKSVMSQSILRLLEHEASLHYEGEILFEGKNILKESLSDLRDIRGNRIAVIFQDALTSLNPVYRIGKQLCEVLLLHKHMTKHEANERALELLRLTGIPSPQRCFKQYPFELSGGMQQRVMIAMALACEPKLLIADEPTTALDVTIQEQILDLIAELNQNLGMSVLFITHNLSAMAQICHSVRVMYLGQIVEEALVDDLFDQPLHPYTNGLLACMPHLEVNRDMPLHVIPGVVPPLSRVPSGCHFCSRCSEVQDRCRVLEPPRVEVFPGHWAKCWKYVTNNAVAKTSKKEGE